MSEIIDKIKKHEIYALWIQLVDSNKLKAKELKTIKFIFYDKIRGMKDRTIKISDSYKDTFRKHRAYIFDIAHFEMNNTISMGQNYDFFYIIKVPENLEVDSKLSIKEIWFERYCSIFRKRHERYVPVDPIGYINKKRIYKDETNPNILSIRIPPSKRKLEIKLNYYVGPKQGGRFYITILSMLTLASIVVTFISIYHSWELYNKIPSDLTWLVHNNPWIHSAIFNIYKSKNTFFGSIVTISLAIVGLMKNDYLNRTRYWFLFPVFISALGFFQKN